MRRFLINRKTATSGDSEIVNLGFGCEMWDQGPVAVVETVPPYQARWFPNLDALKITRIYLPHTGPLAEGQKMQIDLLMVDEQDVNYWTMLASMFGISTEAISPAIVSSLTGAAGVSTMNAHEPNDARLLYQAALMASLETPLSGSGPAM